MSFTDLGLSAPIQKAIADWLSSLSKHDAPAVLSFLEKYGAKMKPFAINEACKFI